jgi:hypothetical protein
MGFVKAGDWLDCMDGKIESKQIRELCGICVNKVYPDEKDMVTAAKEPKNAGCSQSWRRISVLEYPSPHARELDLK